MAVTEHLVEVGTGDMDEEDNDMVISFLNLFALFSHIVHFVNPLHLFHLLSDYLHFLQVYECPGLAPHGEMVVTNPFFMRSEAEKDEKMHNGPRHSVIQLREGCG